MTTEAAPELHDVTKLWWAYALFGFAVFVVGIFFVADPHESLQTFTVIAGILLLLDGLLAIGVAIFARGEGRGLLAMVGVLSAIAGLILVKKPFESLVVFTVIIGIWFVVVGIVRFVSAFGEREGRGLNITGALIDVIAGVVILSWPDLSRATLAVLIGIFLIIRGLLLMYGAWQLRRANKMLAGAA